MRMVGLRYRLVELNTTHHAVGYRYVQCLYFLSGDRAGSAPGCGAGGSPGTGGSRCHLSTGTGTAASPWASARRGLGSAGIWSPG